MAYGQSQALFNWALFAHLHHIISVWFVFVSYGSVDLFCALVIVVMVWFACPKLQTWLATCFGPDKPAYSKKNQATALFLQTLVKFQPTLPRENQITAFSQPNTVSILQTIAKSQPASSRWESNYSLHSPDPTVCILGTGAKLWPLDSR